MHSAPVVYRGLHTFSCHSRFLRLPEGPSVGWVVPKSAVQRGFLRRHAPAHLHPLAASDDHNAGTFVGPGQKVAQHYGGSSGSHGLGHVPGEPNPSVSDHGYAAGTSDPCSFEHRGKLGHADPEYLPCYAHGARSHPHLDTVYPCLYKSFGGSCGGHVARY